MKNLFILALLFPLFAVQAAEKKAEIKVKNKTEQNKVYHNHQQHWHQRDYARDVVLFNCFDSWGNNLRGKFSNEEQYFIELGGGRCHQINTHRNRENINLSQIEHYDFPLSNVYQAIEKIRNEYALNRVKLIQAEHIDAGYKTFKYTLVFESNGRHSREFRIKHNRWTGEVKAIYEV